MIELVNWVKMIDRVGADSADSIKVLGLTKTETRQISFLEVRDT